MSLADDLKVQQDLDQVLRRTRAAEDRARLAMAELRSTRADLALANQSILELEAELSSFHSPVHEQPPLEFQHSGAARRASLFTLASDWHIGERIDPAQMGGVNAFNYEIAKVRAEEYFDKLVELPKRYMAGRKYEALYMGFAGDGTSGGIHDELRETDEFSTLESTRKYRDLVVPGLEYLASHYDWLHLGFTPGNHGRDSKKPRYKGRAEHNADTHAAYLIADALRDRGVKNVSVDISEGIEVNFKVYGVNVRLEHGDEAKGGNGVMGILSPLPRLVLRRQQQAQGEQALGVDSPSPDIVAVGHWHQLVDARGQGFLVNGSLKGYDEFARGHGFKPERAQQGLWVVTPERGLTTFETVHVDNRQKEGW